MIIDLSQCSGAKIYKGIFEAFRDSTRTTITPITISTIKSHLGSRPCCSDHTDERTRALNRHEQRLKQATKYSYTWETKLQNFNVDDQSMRRLLGYQPYKKEIEWPIRVKTNLRLFAGIMKLNWLILTCHWRGNDISHTQDQDKENLQLRWHQHVNAEKHWKKKKNRRR